MRVNEILLQLEDLSYPMTAGTVATELDDVEIQFPNGSERLVDALERCDEEAFDCPEDAKLTLLSSLDGDAVGRKGYSDRDPPTVCDSRADRLSF